MFQMNRKTKLLIDLVTGNPITEDASPISAGKEKNPAAVALGRLGGLKGGKARAKKLSAKQRTEIAKKAAQARWDSK
jgi:hypothetical protein